MPKNYQQPFNTFKKIREGLKLSRNHRNVIWIMVDMTTGFDVTSHLQKDDNKLGSEFNGFTNFTNLVSTNHSTNASLPNLFGGYDHNPFRKNTDSRIKDLTFLEYMKKSVDTVVNPFGEAGWNLTLVNPQYFHYDENNLAYWSSDWQAIENDYRKYGLKCFTANDLSRFMLMEHPERYEQQEIPERIYEQDDLFNDNVALDYFTQATVAHTEKPCFILFSTESNHRPFTVGSAGEYKIGKNDAESAYESTEGFLIKIRNLIRYLKENGIYDNTAIFIGSDHGSCYGSLPVFDESYNFSGQDYSSIRKINKLFLEENNGEHKDHHFIRHFPTMLIKPYDMLHSLIHDSITLHTNTDMLSYIKKFHPTLTFTELDRTQDLRFVTPEEIPNRTLPLPSYGADSKWDDRYVYYEQPTKKLYGNHTFLVSTTIYDPQRYWKINRISAFEPLNRKQFCNPDELSDWTSLSEYLQTLEKLRLEKREILISNDADLMDQEEKSDSSISLMQDSEQTSESNNDIEQLSYMTT